MSDAETKRPEGGLRVEALEHALAPHYPALRAIRRRRELLAHPLYAQIGGEIERVVSGVERGEHPLAQRSDGKRLRVVAWNIRRGTHFDALRSALATDAELSRADVLLLVEVDNGLGRSFNRHVTRELAESLCLNYAFGVSYLTLEDDFGENPEGRESTLALAGAAILSRAPIRRVENVDLPELRDKFSSSEKRLGKKRALLAELELPDGPLTVGVCHLDSTASPAQRALQLRKLLERADAFGVERILIGGDMNTTTYDFSKPWNLARDILHKLLFTGFRATVENYMTPERKYEGAVFEELKAHGYTLEGFNDRTRGSFHYDFHDAYAIEKSRQAVGSLLTWILRWKLRPWNGLVPARLDWFAGRNLRPASATVVPSPRVEGGPPASDHDAIVVDVDV